MIRKLIKPIMVAAFDKSMELWRTNKVPEACMPAWSRLILYSHGISH